MGKRGTENMEQGNDWIKTSIHKVEKWVEDHAYKSYEPFDGLSSVFRPLTFGNLFLDRILMQLIRQCPINLRPLFGVRPLPSTKGRGYMAWGYLKMFELVKNQEYKQKATSCLEWLIENKSHKYNHYSWANHFDFASRGGRYTKDESIIVWTSLIGQAFLDAYVKFNEERYLEISNSICMWILEVPRNQTDTGLCLGYLMNDREKEISVHNSSMLGAAMLARTSKYTGNQDYLNVAKEAMRFSCTRQLPDGSWYYGEFPKYHWIDNFHTGYNLDSLKCYTAYSEDTEFEANLRLGFKYFKENFFEPDGRPKYYHNRAYPIDIQCASQAIDTLAYFSDYDEDALDLALKVAKWTIANMQDKKGFFYYRLYPLMKAKTPMLHWGQATMYKALTHLLSVLN